MNYFHIGVEEWSSSLLSRLVHPNSKALPLYGKGSAFPVHLMENSVIIIVVPIIIHKYTTNDTLRKTVGAISGGCLVLYRGALQSTPCWCEVLATSVQTTCCILPLSLSFIAGGIEPSQRCEY